MERVISEFAETMGKTAEDGVKRMAKSSCKRLASTVQPYGLKGGGKMDRFIKSIALQVGTAYVGVNIGAYPETRSMKEAHYAARKNGVVPARTFRIQKGNRWKFLISETDKDAYTKQAQRKAFRVKAAWVKVANDLGKPKMSGVSPLIKRHQDNAMGSVIVSGKGMGVKVQISNDVPYAKYVQSNDDIKASTMEGMKNGLKYMQTTTAKTIEKANRALK